MQIDVTNGKRFTEYDALAAVASVEDVLLVRLADGTGVKRIPISAIKAFINGDLDTLETEDKTSLIAAINEVFGLVDTNAQDIKALKELDLSMKPSLDFARDMFMFSFYTRGMSFVDMAYLRKTDLQNGILTYRRRKTGQELTIKWEKCMAEIIAKYPENQTDFLLPIIKEQGNERRQYDNALHLVNYRLKELSTMLKHQRPLTMYVARHSWASAAKAKNVPLSVISEGMGHDSEATTQIYLASLETSVVDKANKMILGLL